MRVTFYTLGCKVNQNETGALAQLFEENGYTVVSNEEGADVYIVNSCTVTVLPRCRTAAGTVSALLTPTRTR